MKAYPEYKESEVDNAGIIPRTWTVIPLKHLAENKEYAFVDGPFGSDLKNEEYTDSGIPLIQLNNIKIGEHSLDSLRFVSAKKATELEKHQALPGDIVIAKMADPVARAAKVKSQFEKYIAVADCIKFSPNSELVNTDYLVYSLNAPYFRIQAELVSTGTGRIRIGLTNTKKLKAILPPLPEQQAIADFLDRKTAQIDTLIEKKQRQIDLLQEQRTALINHAVTKGLNPDVRMKDSGVEWLGEIPSHWEDVTLKYLVAIKITDGPHESPEFVDNGIPFVSAEAVQNGKINFDSRRGNITREQHEIYAQKCLAQRDDIFLVKSGATTGKMAYVDTDIEFAIWSPLALIRANKEIVNSRFLFLSLGSAYFQNQVQTFWSYGTQPNIGMKVLENLKVVVPPLNEQIAILKRVEKELQQLDIWIEKARQQIELYQEYRTALISEAVTGKIDVRTVV